MARKGTNEKAEDAQRFTEMFPLCADAVQLMQQNGFGPEHAHPILNWAQHKKPLAGDLQKRFNALKPEQQKEVLTASVDISRDWPQFLHEKDSMNKDLEMLDKPLPEGWAPQRSSSSKEKTVQPDTNQQNSSTASRLPTAGQAVTAVAGLAAAGGAAASWREREQLRDGPQQEAGKKQGALAKTLAFAAGAAVLLGAAFYAYNRSQGQGASR